MSVDEYMRAYAQESINHKPIHALMESTYMCASVNMHILIRTWTSIGKTGTAQGMPRNVYTYMLHFFRFC